MSPLEIFFSILTDIAFYCILNLSIFLYSSVYLTFFSQLSETFSRYLRPIPFSHTPLLRFFSLSFSNSSDKLGIPFAANTKDHVVVSVLTSRTSPVEIKYIYIYIFEIYSCIRIYIFTFCYMNGLNLGYM